jgi:hypothetical protein
MTTPAIVLAALARIHGGQPYHGGFESRDDVAKQFETTLADDIQIILAGYVYEDYSGSAYVLFVQGDKLYEVHGSHCSCYGLENQWDPEEVTVDELRHRVEKGNLLSWLKDSEREAAIRILREVTT